MKISVYNPPPKGALRHLLGQYLRPIPAICRACGDPGIGGLDICASCYRHLPRNRRGCVRCAEPLPAAGALCARCQQHLPAFDQVLAPWHYQPPMDWLAQELKFRHRLASGRLLGELLGRWLQREGAVADVIIPMPLHGSRLRERGFNQATELATPIAARLGIPLDRAALQRVRATAAQTSLPLRERKRNLRRAFRCECRLDGLRIALVDDVVTTGSTADAAAATLKRAGATEVHLWAVCRAARGGGSHT
ncbi:MAG: ComF family protein [Ectothiorhodospiraceae bacterium]|nr:ComF family protein [Ectothiorhodospiraceae bacterium]MCH8504622.1 ComF family protein [Ectothiorhodospiraceae bacterium]